MSGARGAMLYQYRVRLGSRIWSLWLEAVRRP
jgi:hypothetical protein